MKLVKDNRPQIKLSVNYDEYAVLIEVLMRYKVRPFGTPEDEMIRDLIAKLLSQYAVKKGIDLVDLRDHADKFLGDERENEFL